VTLGTCTLKDCEARIIRSDFLRHELVPDTWTPDSEHFQMVAVGQHVREGCAAGHLVTRYQAYNT